MEETRRGARKRPGWFRIASSLALTAVALCVGCLVLLTGDNRAADWAWSHASRPRAIGHLVDKYFSHDPDRSKSAEAAILALRDEQDIYALIRHAATHSRDGDALERLCGVIGRIGEPAALPLYKTLVAMNYEDNALQRKATYTGRGLLGIIQSRFARMREARNDALFHVAWEALGAMGKPAIRPLLPFISDARKIERWHALRILRTMNDPRAVKPVIALANSSKGQIRSDALEALAQQLSPLAADTFVAILTQTQGPPSRVTADAQFAAVALGKLKDLRALPWLVRIAMDGHCFYQWEAVTLLADYSQPEAEPALIGIIRGQDFSSDFRVRKAAAESLAKIGTPTARKAVSDAGMDEFAYTGGEERDIPILPVQSTTSRADMPANP